MKKQKEDLPEPSAPFWMTTFSDMVTLLLVFFILILSYSTVQLDKFRGAMSSMKGALGVMPEMTRAAKRTNSNLEVKINTRLDEMELRIEEVKRQIIEKKLDDLVQIGMDEGGIHIRMGENLLFDLSKAELKPAAYPVLKDIAELVIGEYKEIYVEGHTDNIPIHTAKYPTNWELSSARALSVVRYLHKNHGIEAKYLAAVGHAEHRPLVPNTSAKNRAQNRRVEIFIKW